MMSHFTLRKNKSIAKALTSEIRTPGPGTILRGEVVYLEQTAFRRVEVPRKLIGIVRDRNDDADSVLINVYNDHLETCQMVETCRLRLEAKGMWERNGDAITRKWEYGIFEWDRESGDLTRGRGKIVVMEWQRADSRGMPSAAQERTAFVQSLIVDGESIPV